MPPTWLTIAAWVSLAAASSAPRARSAGEYIADFTLAFALGIGFQYCSVAPMRGLGFRDGTIAALTADTLSLTDFDVGLFGSMALVSSCSSPPRISRPTTPPSGCSCKSAWSSASPPPTRSTAG